MIGISRLYLGEAESSDRLRYSAQAGHKPIVVWNITRRCNLNCLHCYADACPPQIDCSEVSTATAKAVIDDLAGFKIPVLLFSGGEPLLRSDLPELAAHAKRLGLRVVVSSNGTLVDKPAAMALKQAGVSYLGISLDGLAATHNRLRQSNDAFERALGGLAAARAAGLKTGLRITLTRENIAQIDEIFALAQEHRIGRICFYHLVTVGRGHNLADLVPTACETRRAIDAIIAAAGSARTNGFKKEVLTVDNHADGPYLWLRLQREDPQKARRVWELLSISGGASSGTGIAAIDWKGDVLPDQFWQNRVLGNVFEQPFGEIWAGGGKTRAWGDESVGEFLRKLRNKQAYVQGRCSGCRFLAICGGNFRARADMLTGNPWAEDPACYLTDMEISGPVPYSDMK